MNESAIPEELDWVSARAKCSPFQVFENLRFKVEEDMRKRNQLPITAGFPRREYALQGQGQWFAVVQTNQFSQHSGVAFYLSEDGITVKDVETREVMFDAVVVISDDGRCKLKVGQREYNLWQFRKLALQDAFFINRQVIP